MVTYNCLTGTIISYQEHYFVRPLPPRPLNIALVSGCVIYLLQVCVAEEKIYREIERKRERERERREREQEKRPNFEILETADLSNPIVLRSGSKLAIPLLSLLLEGDVYASKQNNFEMTNST
jgi:hypothetical protein